MGGARRSVILFAPDRHAALAPASAFARRLATSPGAGVLLALTVVALDYATGPFVHFQLLWTLPVAWMAWSRRTVFASVLAFALPMSRVVLAHLWGHPASATERAVDAIVACAALALCVAIVAQNRRQRDALAREVQKLRGLLPICAFCKRIRDERQAWLPVEQFVEERSEASFTHSVCPPCAKTHYGVELTEGGR